jgi:hypothetical protein
MKLVFYTFGSFYISVKTMQLFIAWTFNMHFMCILFLVSAYEIVMGLRLVARTVGPAAGSPRSVVLFTGVYSTSVFFVF